MRNFICPYCMNEYSKRKILYWCTKCNKEVKPKSIFSRNPFVFNNKKENCSVCGEQAVRVCPVETINTGTARVLKKPFLENPNLPFSIIGVRSSGKTNYITVMLHELGNPELQLHLGVNQLNRKDNNDYEKNWERINDEHKTPEATPKRESFKDLNPQIWQIKNNQRQHGSITPTYTFTIFDGAGEDHEAEIDTTSNVCNYIKTSKAILLIIDPLSLSNIITGGFINSEDIKNSLRGASRGEKSEDIIMNLADYIKEIRGIKSYKKLDIPVAVVLTKFDLVANHPAFGKLIRDKERKMAIVHQDSDNKKFVKVNIDEIKKIDGEIRGWLEQIGEKQFINNLNANFKNYCFFGVSSYGDPPSDEGSTPKDIKPHRVLDPILWLFKIFNIID